MNIKEAVLEAQRVGKGIIRESDETEVYVLPTNTNECCLLIPPKEEAKVGRRWNPTLDDLTADDWCLYG